MYKIIKFGGTSVGTADAMRQVAAIVQQQLDEGHQLTVVASALAGVTNQLLGLATLAQQGGETWRSGFHLVENRHYDLVKELLPAAGQSAVLARLKVMCNQLEDVLQGITTLRELSPRSTDLVAGWGERLSVVVLAAFLQHLGLPAVAKDASAFIKTDDRFGRARVLFEVTNPLVQQHIDKNGVDIVTGFVASTVQGAYTTLGRGGSDYTAAILAAALQADNIEIWTDVDGIMTADPKVVEGSFTQASISFQEALELCHFGAKVIYPPTLHPAIRAGIPLLVKNTFNPQGAFTTITPQAHANPYAVKGISSIAQVALFNLQGTSIMGVSGVSARLFAALARAQVNVILISQASSEHSICWAVHPAEAADAQQAVQAEFATEFREGSMEPLQLDTEVGVVAAVGENMRRSPGVSGRLFTALGRNGVNIVASAQGSSELNISVVVARNDLRKAVNVLHDIFFYTNRTTLHLALIGPGLIGSTLLHQIHTQAAWLAEHKNLTIRLVGLINTKKMLVSPQGIDLAHWQHQLTMLGDAADLGTWVQQLLQHNLPNTVVADCTAGPATISFYEHLLKASIAIVTPNKTANSGPYARYRKLRSLARQHNTQFLYETNAGAGLPIITTLRDLISSGDRIHRIQGVLSGTLSYIFNSFGPQRSFKQCVAEAQALGYTEPDPRDDLSGQDMARKMLILAREAGIALEPEDIEIDQILPPACLQARSVAQFYDALDAEQAYFDAMSEKARTEGTALRFIGVIEGRKVAIRLSYVGPESPFFSMRGSDNMVVFETDRYKPDAPMVVKGPGAGAEVTSAGVFAEVIALGTAAGLKRL